MWKKSILLLLLPLCGLSGSAQTAWTLELCVAEAEKNDLTIRDRALELQISQLDKDQARASFIPTLNGFATHGYNWGRVIDPFTNTFASDRVRTNNLGVQADVDLFQGFRKQHNLEQATVGIEISEQSLEAAKVQLRTAVVDNFLSLLDIQERLQMARIQLTRTKDQSTDLSIQIEAGNRARADLFDLEAQIAQEEYNLTDLEVQRDRAKLSLIQLLQLSGTSVEAFTVTAPDITGVDVQPGDQVFDDVMASARDNFPAYRQAVLSERSAALSVKIAEAGRYPSLRMSGSLGSGYSGRNTEILGDPIFGTPIPIGLTASGESVFTENVSYNTATKGFGSQLNDNFNQSLSVSLSLPIFNGLQNKVAISKARIRREQATNQMQRTTDQLSIDVQNALAMQASSYKQFLAAERNYEAAEESFKYAVQRLEQGVITSLEMRTSKANLDLAASQMINAKYGAVLAKKYIDILQGKPLKL